MVPPQAVLENVANGPIPDSCSGFSSSASEVNRVLRKYADLPADLARRLLDSFGGRTRGTGDILTLDSDFRVYRWGSNKPFRFLLEVR